jgi:hypothetical protein
MMVTDMAQPVSRFLEELRADELEERLEFGPWTSQETGSTTCTSGAPDSCTGTVPVSSGGDQFWSPEEEAMLAEMYGGGYP